MSHCSSRNYERFWTEILCEDQREKARHSSQIKNKNVKYRKIRNKHREWTKHKTGAVKEKKVAGGKGKARKLKKKKNAGWVGRRARKQGAGNVTHTTIFSGYFLRINARLILADETIFFLLLLFLVWLNAFWNNLIIASVANVNCFGLAQSSLMGVHVVNARVNNNKNE